MAGQTCAPKDLALPLYYLKIKVSTNMVIPIAISPVATITACWPFIVATGDYRCSIIPIQELAEEAVRLQLSVADLVKFIEAEEEEAEQQ